MRAVALVTRLASACVAAECVHAHTLAPAHRPALAFVHIWNKCDERRKEKTNYEQTFDYY